MQLHNFLGRHSLMAGLRIPIQFLEPLPPVFESKCPFFICIIFHSFHLFPLASFLKGTSDIHCMAVLGLAQYCLAVLGLAQYCSAVLSSARQCSAVLGSAQQCLAVLSSARHCSTLLGTARHCSALLGSARHCLA